MARFNLTAGKATLSLAVFFAGSVVSQAATSLTNSLTGLTGNSSQPATQAQITAAGLELFSYDGLAEDFSANPSVNFDTAGAHFGQQFILDGGGGDGGRNYMRTIVSDYATASYVAEVTVIADLGAAPTAFQQLFFGMGSGDTALFGVPDWSTQFSSTFVTPEIGFFKTWSSANDVNFWNDNDPQPTLTGAQTLRLRMSFDATTRVITYAMDQNYAGGAFAADYTAPPLDLNTVNCPENCGGGTDADLFDPATGWPEEPSRIFFGGDDGVIFKDFSVTVGGAENADFNGDTFVDGADFLTWQRGIGLTNATPAQGDANGDGNVNGADLGIWTNQFGTTPAVVAASSAPEPTALVLAGLGVGWLAARRRTARGTR